VVIPKILRAPATATLPTGSDLKSGRCAPLCPFWTLNVSISGQLVRRVLVLAPSAIAALEKGREQLDDGESLSFCFDDPAPEHLGLPPTSRVYQPR